MASLPRRGSTLLREIRGCCIMRRTIRCRSVYRRWLISLPSGSCSMRCIVSCICCVRRAPRGRRSMTCTMASIVCCCCVLRCVIRGACCCSRIIIRHPRGGRVMRGLPSSGCSGAGIPRSRSSATSTNTSLIRCCGVYIR